MPEPYGDLSRASLDTLAMRNGGRIGLGCAKHPQAGCNAIYQDGALRLICRECGFEAAKVKVADRG